MLSQAVITAWGLCTLAVQAVPSDAELLAGLPDYYQTGKGDDQGDSAALLLVGVTQQASPRYNLPLVQSPQKMSQL